MYVAVVQPDDPVRKRQPKAKAIGGSGCIVFNAVKRLKNSFDLFGWYPSTFVFNADGDDCILSIQADSCPVVGRIFTRVDHNIFYGGFQQGLIAVHH